MWRLENSCPLTGSASGSFRARSSIGSIFNSYASASIALSTANVPIDSPGARMKVLAMRWSFVTFWPMR